MQNPLQTKSINSQKSKTKSRISKRQRNRRRNKQKLLNQINQNKALSHFPIRRSPQRNGADIWREAYENAIRWQTEHQGNYWRCVAKNLERENELLRQQLQQRMVNPKPDVNYETSDGDEEEEANISVKKEKLEALGDEVDVKYLEFLQITFKHREELRLKRQAEAQAQEVAEPLVEVETPVQAEEVAQEQMLAQVEIPTQGVSPASS